MPSLKRILSRKLFHLLLLSSTILYYFSLHAHQNLESLRLQSEVFKQEWLREDWRTGMRFYPADDGRIHVSAVVWFVFEVIGRVREGVRSGLQGAG